MKTAIAKPLSVVIIIISSIILFLSHDDIVIIASAFIEAMSITMLLVTTIIDMAEGR